MTSADSAFDDADLNGFVDGRIEPSRAAALSESLASDPQARARIDAWKRQNESLRTMFASVLFEPVPARLQPGTIPRPAPPEPEALRPSPAPQPPNRLAGTVAVIALGAALVGFVLGALASLGTDGFGLAPRGVTEIRPVPAAAGAASRSLADRALEAHRTYLGDALRPVELTAADEPRLLRWIRHKVDPAARIPDFARLGWTLIGGRVLPGPRGPEGFLVYGNGPDRLGLTLSRAASPHALRMTAVDGPDTIGAASWGDDTFGYALTSERGADWLERNAGALRDSIRQQSSAGAEAP